MFNYKNNKKYMKKIQEKLEKVFKSKVLLRIVYVLGILVLAVLIFSAGMSVGFHKAQFGRAWGENYERNFGMKPDFPGPGFGRDNMPNAHGAVGKIIKIENSNLIVQDAGNIEKVVLVKEDTQIFRMKDLIKLTDLKLDDFIVVIGSPNDQGQVEAKLIRLMPNPDFMNSNSINTPEVPKQ
jgi:hypothetical protein